LFPGGVELRARRRALGEHAIADVGQPKVLEVALEGGGVGLDRVRGETEVARAGVSPLAEIHAPLERDAVDDDAGLVESRLAGDEAR
jgi:hypothetical protein